MVSNEQALTNKIRVQKEGREAWFKAYCRGTLAWATGVGKTKAAIDIIEQLRHEYLQRYAEGMPQGLLVTPTEEMRDIDWPAEFELWNVSMEGITSVCYASLAKEKLEKYDFIIYDECHRLTMANLKRQAEANKPALGLTATFPKAMYEEEAERVNLLAALLPPVHSIGTDEAVDLGLIADFEVMVLKFHLDDVNKNIKAGTKAKPFMTTEKAQYAYLTKRIQMAIVKKIDGLRYAAIANRAKFLYNLPSKLRLAKLCLSKLNVPGKRTIVFSGSIEQANELGGDNVYHSLSTRDALQRFQDKIIDLIVAVRALNEGKNLTEPDQALVAQMDSIDRNIVQRIGRVIRRRKDNPAFKARVVILVALGTADEQWYKTAIADFDSKRIQETLVRVPKLEPEVINTDVGN